MATVHLAHQMGPNQFVKPCVLKRITPIYAEDQQVRLMFMEEARITALLNHPNVVQTIDFGEVKGVPFIAMELVNGVNLAQLLKVMAKNQRWIAPAPAVAICDRVLQALAYAHSLHDLEGQPLNLVHRDVSPQNILLSRVGEVKLADFGIARHDAREAQTLGVSPKGKPGYMAPEQAMGVQIDQRADVFALGIVLVELLCAKRVLRTGQPVAGLMGLSKRIEEMLSARTDLPASLVSLAQAMTAMEPDDRPETSQAALRRMMSVADELTPPDLTQFLGRTLNRYFPTDTGYAHLGLGEDSNDLIPQSSPVSLDRKPPEAPIEDLSTDLLAGHVAGGEATDQPRSDPGSLLADLRAELYDALPEPHAQRLTLPKPDASGHITASLDIDFTDEESSSTGASAGWPAEFSGKGESNIVKGRSSAMEHMDQFGARHSEAASKRGLDPDVDRVDRVDRVERGVLTALPAQPAPSPPVAPSKGALISIKDEKLDQALADAAEELEPDKEKGSSKGLPPVIPLLFGGLVVAALGLGLIFAVLPSRNEDRSGPTSGRVLVSSQPPGAQIFLDERPTMKTTPAELEGLPLDQPFKLSVRLKGYLAVPKIATLYIQRDTPHTAASFALKKGRAYRLRTEPSGARDMINGHRLPEVTPLQLDPIPMGETATIRIRLEDHIPARLLLTATAETATLTEVKLEPGVRIDITSSPSGARVTLDGEARGQTPLYDVLVHAEKKTWVRIRKRGYRGWGKRIIGARLKVPNLVAELEALPLLSMPGMTRSERKEARQLDRALNAYSRKIRSLERSIQRGEKKLEAVQNSKRLFVSDVTKVQSKHDELNAQLIEAEQGLEETTTSIDSFRERIQQRLDRGR